MRSTPELTAVVRESADARLIRCNNPRISPEVHTFLGMPAVLASTEMRRLLEVVAKIAATNASVLITGETGTGKELIARAVHHFSKRMDQPWVDVNCAALPEHLLESELFGYEKGAFTGADGTKPGMFELAEGGTLFLDEVGELDLAMQVKLLRVLAARLTTAWGAPRKSRLTFASLRQRM
jgi:transcriptional regulator with PAS, ATPase and Fis domain